MKNHLLFLLGLVLFTSCATLIEGGLEGAGHTVSTAVESKTIRTQNGELIISSFSFKKIDSLPKKSIVISGELSIKAGTKRNQTFYDLRPIVFTFQCVNAGNKEVRKDMIHFSIDGVLDLSSLEVNKTYGFKAMIDDVPTNQFDVITNVKYVGSNEYQFISQ